MRARLALLAIVCLLPASGAVADMIPYNTYLAGDFSDIHPVLDDKDGIDQNPTGVAGAQPWGILRFQGPGAIGGLAPPNTQLWVIAANDGQVVGELVTFATGTYNFANDGFENRINADWGSTPSIDEGASPFEPLIVAAEIDGAYYEGSFISGVLVDGYVYTNQRNDILITSTILGPVPEPATLALLGSGLVGLLGLTRRRRVR